MEIPSGPDAAAQSGPPSGFLDGLGWFLSGAVLPLGSLSFYRRATRRPAGGAVRFFIVFTVIISILATIKVVMSLAGMASDIHDAYARGAIPVVSIAGGVAQVDGPQPVVFVDSQGGGMLAAIDTSGRINEIDQTRYQQGFLLTRTELHILNTGESYQRLPLSEINTIFNADPLVINERTVTNAWIAMTAGFAVPALLGLVVWNTLVRLVIIATLALILWGIGCLIRPKTEYGVFLVTGLYAAVPAIYISHVFSRSEVSFFGLQTLLLLTFWTAALAAALSGNRFFTTEMPLRPWTALIGLPLVVWLVVDMFANLPSPTGQIVLCALIVISGVALICVRLYFHLSAMQPSAEPGPLSPPS